MKTFATVVLVVAGVGGLMVAQRPETSKKPVQHLAANEEDRDELMADADERQAERDDSQAELDQAQAERDQDQAERDQEQAEREQELAAPAPHVSTPPAPAVSRQEK